jgi:nicotinamide-nucleotide amidase
MEPDRKLQPILSQLADLLQEKNKRLAVAESCTGGWIAKVITDLPGSSVWFDCGFVTYSNEAKQQMLQVNPKTLDAYGAVSEAVVAEMAEGVLDNSSADMSLSVSGIAGPGGGTADKPVGTVCFAWKSRDSKSICETVLLQGDRNTIRMQSVIHALKGVINMLNGQNNHSSKPLHMK